SSSGRHTRFSRDWSSDVCSSDLFTRLGPFEELLEARIADQVADRLAAILRRAEAEQFLGGRVPPVEIALGIQHHHGVAQRGGGFLDSVDHRLQATAPALTAALQAIDGIEDLAPEAVALRWLGI